MKANNSMKFGFAWLFLMKSMDLQLKELQYQPLILNSIEYIYLKPFFLLQD